MMVIEKGWQELLKEELGQPYIGLLKSFIQTEVCSGGAIYPPLPQVFEAFRFTPYDQVKVVIMGQDPYHGPNQAHGLCFSVQKGTPIPPSLKNIYKELEADLGIPPPTHGHLEHWAKQGVLMLNATLTVSQGEPKSHYGQGWERFTDAVVRKLVEREDPIVFLLWGRSAQEKCETVLGEKKHPHAVLKAAHPSPFSATRFFGCRHFSQTNALLKEWKKTPIDWRI